MAMYSYLLCKDVFGNPPKKEVDLFFVKKDKGGEVRQVLQVNEKIINRFDYIINHGQDTDKPSPRETQTR